MAQIHNQEVTKALIDGAKLQIAIDKIPNQIAEKVVPTMEVNPKLLKFANIVARGSSATTGTTTIYTCPEDKDFYLTSFVITYYKDATNDGTLVYLGIAPYGQAVLRLVDINSATTTAQNFTEAISYTIPIKLDRGSAITLVKSFSAGTGVYSATITGYTD